MTPEEINKMTGADTMNRPTLKKRKAIRVDGKKGGLVVTHLDQPKDDVDGYKTERIEQPIDVVFLKVRRRLMQGSKSDGIVKYTTEHDTPTDVVTLFIKEGNKQETAPANELREKYPDLKTEQIVYVRWNGQVCKLSVKGLSLKGEEYTTSFYEYLSKNENWYQFFTKIGPTKGEEYYLLDFRKGEQLTDEQLTKVIEDIKEVYEDCRKVDNAFTPRPAVTKPEPSTLPNTDVEYPTSDDEEINPEDIPF